MSPLLLAVVAVALFIGAAFVIRQSQAKGEPGPAVLQSLVPHAAEPLRVRSQFEMETDEDLAYVESAFRELRRQERTQAALDRFARLQSGSTSSKTKS